MLIQAFKFVVVGVANTCVGLGVIYALKWGAGMDDVPANLLGYLVGLCVSFTLNRKWTFRFSGEAGGAALRFAFVFLVSYGLNLVSMLALRDMLHVNSYLAHLYSTAPYTLAFFIGSKYYVFRELPRPGAELSAVQRETGGIKR